MITLRIIFVSLIFTTSALAMPAPVPSNLVAWYPGDGNANDISGNNLNPTTTFGSAKFSIGRVGQAMKFVRDVSNSPLGTGDGYSVADNDLLDIGGMDSFSVEFWSFTSSLSGTFVDKRELTQNGYRGYVIYQTYNSVLADIGGGGNGCTIAFDLYEPGVPLVYVLYTLPSCTNPYTHYAFVFDRAQNELNIYRNGNLVVQVNPTVASGDLSNTAPFNISQAGVGSSFGNWDGSIDELSVYKKALTFGEIQAIYNAGTEGKEKSTPVPVGMAVQRAVGDLTATFPEITKPGDLFQTTVDPSTQQNLPTGFLTSGLAYDISTSALFTGNVTVCFNLPSITDSELFSRLRVMHNDDATWIDKTTFSEFATRTLCGQTSSFSPFAIAQQLAPSSALVSVGGRILTANGSGISRARVSLIDSNGQVRYAVSNSFGFYKFEELSVGESYILSVSSKGFQFDSQIVSPTENISDQNFVANE